jgi:uncharacterized protein (TIGR00290 family)
MKGVAMDSIKGRPFFCSWSGGKDSCLALYHAIKGGGVPKFLLTMMADERDRSRSHGLSKNLLEEQARQLGIPIIFRTASWDEYEKTFIEAIREFKAQGIDTGVFGDIDVEPNRQWVLRVCGQAGVTPLHPLWQRPRRELLDEFIGLGFKATIVVVNNTLMNPRFLGMSIDPKTVAEMEQAGIDASGELGEYHTVVTDGPIFANMIVPIPGKSQVHGDYTFLDIPRHGVGLR